MVSSWWADLLKDNPTVKTEIYTGIGAYRLNPNEFPTGSGDLYWDTEGVGAEELERQLKFNIANPNIDGTSIFTYGSLYAGGKNADLALRKISDTLWNTPALVPSKSWANIPMALVPTILGATASQNGVNLTWKNTDKNARYFALYRFAENEAVSIENPKNLIARIYVSEDGAQSYLDTTGKAGDRYVITALNRVSQESMPSNVQNTNTQPTETFVTTFDVDGIKTHVTTTVGAAIILPANPIKSGYSFMGWYTAKVGGVKVTAFTTAQTVYAQFQKEITPPSYIPTPPVSQDRVVEDSNNRDIAAFIPKEVTNVTNPILQVAELPDWSITSREFAIAAKDFSLIKTFMIYLYDSTTRVTQVEGGKIKIEIPFIGTAGKEYIVLRYNDDKTITEFKATYVNGKISFETDHFSTYAIVAKADVTPDQKPTIPPKTGDTTPINVIIVLAFMGATLVVVRKKYLCK